MFYAINNHLYKKNNAFVGYSNNTPIDPYNPLGLPPNTIRIKFISGYLPNMGDVRTRVDSTNNVWDIYKQSNDWSYLFQGWTTQLLEVLGANTTNVTSMERMFINCGTITNVTLFDTSNVLNMAGMFQNCTNLTTIPLFDTSNVLNMASMFQNCTNLTTIPLFDTSKVSIIIFMLYNCTHIQSGSLALYQQASTQADPPSFHLMTFRYCGKDTITGASELAQIPSDWK